MKYSTAQWLSSGIHFTSYTVHCLKQIYTAKHLLHLQFIPMQYEANYSLQKINLGFETMSIQEMVNYI